MVNCDGSVQTIALRCRCRCASPRTDIGSDEGGMLLREQIETPRSGDVSSHFR